MTLTRLRVLTVHYSHFLFPAAYMAVLAIDVFDPTPDWVEWLPVLIPMIAVMVVAAILVVRHQERCCQRCEELRPRVTPRVDFNPNMRQRRRKLHVSHMMWWPGGAAQLWGAIVMLFALCSAHPNAINARIVGDIVFAAGAWWVAYFQYRHIVYYTHICPWCMYRRQERLARRERRSGGRL